MKLRIRPGPISTPATAYIFGLATAGLVMLLDLLPHFRDSLILRSFLIGVVCGAAGLAIVIIAGLIVSFGDDTIRRDDRAREELDRIQRFHRGAVRLNCAIPGCKNEVRRPETGQCEYHNGWIAPASREEYYKRYPKP